MSINTNSRARIVIRPCGACKYLRKRCVDDCIFAPYFDSDEGIVNFASVHKIFGGSNISKLLMTVPIQNRTDVVFTLCLEANARLQDPIYRCIPQICNLCDLKNQVHNLQTQISWLKAHIATQLPPQLPTHLPPAQLPPLSMSDFPIAGTATYDDMSRLIEFDPNIGSSQQQFEDDQDPLGAGAPVGGGGGEETYPEHATWP